MPSESAENFMPWSVIAGGSEGVGACFAHRLAERGVNIVLAARKPGPLEETAQAIRRSHGVKVRTLSVDLGRSEAATELISACSDIEVGGFIYNAGAAHGLKPFLDQPLDDYLALMRLNTETPVRLARHFGRGMRERGRGSMIFIGSGAGAGGTANLAGYSAGKAYIETLAEGLWLEMQPVGVEVLCLVLGLTNTPAMARAGFGMDGGEFQPDDPDLVACTGLDKIGQGPVQTMASIKPYIDHINSLPRAEAVRALSASSINLT